MRSRWQCRTSASSVRARRRTEPSLQPSARRVDAGLAAMHQTVLPCDETERCGGPAGGGLTRIAPLAKSHSRISLPPPVLKRRRGDGHVIPFDIVPFTNGSDPPKTQ